ncbi:hypothetical protein BGZ51_009275, partial [Haplosporangium sp. Z 767]
MASINENKGVDSISKIFNPCGVDDVDDKDMANATQQCFANRAIKDDEEVDGIDMEGAEEEAEVAQVEEEYSEA